MAADGHLLVRIVVGKIINRERLLATLRNVPVVQDDPDFNCVVWVQQALLAVQQDGECVSTSEPVWQKIRDSAMTYVQQKKDAHRFDGKVKFDMSKTATYDLLQRKEIIP